MIALAGNIATCVANDWRRHGAAGATANYERALRAVRVAFPTEKIIVISPIAIHDLIGWFPYVGSPQLSAMYKRVAAADPRHLLHGRRRRTDPAPRLHVDPAAAGLPDLSPGHRAHLRRCASDHRWRQALRCRAAQFRPTRGPADDAGGKGGDGLVTAESGETDHGDLVEGEALEIVAELVAGVDVIGPSLTPVP